MAARRLTLMMLTMISALQRCLNIADFLKTENPDMAGIIVIVRHPTYDAD